MGKKRWHPITEKYWGRATRSTHSNYKRFKAWQESTGVTHVTEDIPFRLAEFFRKGDFDKNDCLPFTSIIDCCCMLHHISLYKNENTGEGWIVCHPYHLSAHQLSELLLWCKENNFFIELRGDCWFYPGETFTLILSSLFVEDSKYELS